MPHRQPMNVSLTPELASFVRAEVESGRYATASEVVRASLRMMEDRDGDRPRGALTSQTTVTA